VRVMLVQDAMTRDVVSVGPSHTLRRAAQKMTDKKVGAAVVFDPEIDGIGILTERDIMTSIGRGEDPDKERVFDHVTTHLRFAEDTWPIDTAAIAMFRGGFRHLIVLSAGEVAGMVSVRDIVRSYVQRGLDAGTLLDPEEIDHHRPAGR